MRILYELCCLRDPSRSLGLGAGETIHIVPISRTVKAAQNVVFGGVVKKLELSPWFRGRFKSTMDYVEFPDKRIKMVGGASTDASALGLNVYSAIIDEGNFMGEVKATDAANSAGGKTYDRAQMIYDALVRRVKSRYQRSGVKGMVFLVSSKRATDDFTERRIREHIKNKTTAGVFVRDYCLAGDTKIPLLDGSEKTIADLADQYSDSDEKFWVYSVDNKGLIVPGSAYRPRLTKRNVPVVSVELDNGETVRLTADHRVMLRSGRYREAGKLRPGDSLMPLYRQIDNKGYEQLSQPLWDGRWQKTHHMSARHTFDSWPKRGSDGKPTCIHHEDFDKRNNTPENLSVREWTEHQKIHRDNMDCLLRYVKSDKHRKYASAHMRRLHRDPEFAARRNARGRRWLEKLRADPEFRKRHAAQASKTLTEFLTSPEGAAAQKKRINDYWDKRGRSVTATKILEGKSRGLTQRELAAELEVTDGAIGNYLRRIGLPTYTNVTEEQLLDVVPTAPVNHKVVSVKQAGRCDVYDLSVEEHENFGLAAGIFVHNCTWNVKPDAFSHQKWYKCSVSSSERLSLNSQKIISRNSSAILQVASRAIPRSRY